MIRIVVLFFLGISVVSCANKLQEIPLNEVSDDLKRIARESVINILQFCDSKEDFTKFKLRSSTKSYVHFNTGKYQVTCYVYQKEASSIKLGRLYKVNRLQAYVKRFKYKLDIVSEKYELMEIHLDLNSDKNIADYKLYGKPKNGKWISIIDEVRLDIMKQMNEKE